MFPVFLATETIAGEAVDGYLDWYLGLTIYWLVWGGLFAIRMIGPARLKALIRPRRPTRLVVALVAFPILMAGAVRLLPGMAYEKRSAAVWVLLISTAFGNGFFEELLWRGVYLELFRDRLLWRAVWPSVWFALWHIIPVSTQGGGIAAMVIGPLFFGFYLAFLARLTDSLWWPIVAHVFGGIVMVS